VITLHRLGHKLEVFQLNPDHIATIEATPDTVITLTNGVKIVVGETPQRVCAEVKDYRIEILSGAMTRRREHHAAAPHGQRPVHLAAVESREA